MKDFFQQYPIRTVAVSSLLLFSLCFVVSLVWFSVFQKGWGTTTLLACTIAGLVLSIVILLIVRLTSNQSYTSIQQDTTGPIEEQKELDPETKMTVAIFYGFVALGLGLLLVIARFNDIKGAIFIDSNDWQTTQGVIISSDVEEETDKYGKSWRHKIIYEYTLNDKMYKSDQIHFRGYTASKDKTFAYGYVKKYPVGKQVTVFYESNNPLFSSLEPNINQGINKVVIGISCFLLAGFGLILIGMYIFIVK